jgi:hypothetical protein
VTPRARSAHAVAPRRRRHARAEQRREHASAPLAERYARHDAALDRRDESQTLSVTIAHAHATRSCVSTSTTSRKSCTSSPAASRGTTATRLTRSWGPHMSCSTAGRRWTRCAHASTGRAERAQLDAHVRRSSTAPIAQASAALTRATVDNRPCAARTLVGARGRRARATVATLTKVSSARAAHPAARVCVQSHERRARRRMRCGRPAGSRRVARERPASRQSPLLIRHGARVARR